MINLSYQKKYYNKFINSKALNLNMLQGSTKKSNSVEMLLDKTKTFENNILFPLLVLYLGVAKRSKLFVFVDGTQKPISDNRSGQSVRLYKILKTNIISAI